MKEKLRKFFLAMLSVFLISPAVAQERTISGRVTSADDNSPLAGVTIEAVGSSIGTQTNDQGNYSIIVPTGTASLRFSSLGFNGQTVSLTASNTLNLSLVGAESALDEVVVVAYGTARRATHVGSLAQVTSAQIENRPVSNALNSVIGSAPGIQGTVAQGAPGSAPNIRIRGFGSISASNSPLYVVDGVPYDAGSANINPEDIASISILKDASTTALYGSRGANGVVMITTKRGTAGKSNLNINISGGIIERGLPEYDRVGPAEYYELMWEAYRNNVHYGGGVPMDIAASIASGLTTSHEGDDYVGIANILGYNPFNVANNDLVGVNGRINPSARLLYPDDLDWAEATAQGGKRRQNYSLSYDGGTEKTDYFASVGYTQDEGFLIKSDMRRFTGRVNVNTRATDWLTTGLNLNASYMEANYENVPSGGSTSFINPFHISRNIGPIYPIHLHDPVTGAYILDENGNRQYDPGDQRLYSSGRHPIWENILDEQIRHRESLGARTYLEAKILPVLTARTNVSFDIQNNHEREFDNAIIGDGAPAGRASQGFYRHTSYTWNQLLEYKQSFGMHNVGAMVGHENYFFRYNNLTGGKNSLIVDGNIEFPNFAVITSANSQQDRHAIESYLSRIDYDYDEKYIFSATFRRDGNSKFHPSFRWENFWSLGGAYNIERESFFDVSWVDLLKLRASYGVVGNDGGLGYYPYQAVYTLGRNNNMEPGFVQRSLPNDSLTWETAKNFDVGIDFSLFKGRLSGSVEYFDRRTDGLIFAVPVSLAHGGVYNVSPYYHTIDMNVGSLYNKGFEFQLTGRVVQKEDFMYATTLNVTTIKNRLTSMPDVLPNILQSGQHGRSVGHSIYDFHMRRFYGVDPANGDALYYTDTETENSTVIDGNLVTNVLGEANLDFTGHSAIPDLYGSMMHNLSFKGLTLDILFTYQLGGYVYDSAYGSLMHGGNYGNALHVDVANRWQQPGDVTNTPRLDAGNVANLAGGSDRFLVSASYLNINNITLGYSLPQRLSSQLGAQNVSLFVSGENLAMFSARSGLDVAGSFNGSVASTYNFMRTYSLGARLRF